MGPAFDQFLFDKRRTYSYSLEPGRSPCAWSLTLATAANLGQGTAANVGSGRARRTTPDQGKPTLTRTLISLACALCRPYNWHNRTRSFDSRLEPVKKCSPWPAQRCPVAASLP